VNAEIEKDIKNMKEHLKFEEKSFKVENAGLDKRIDQVRVENSIISVKVKEKEQEVKLSDLKIKEMKKSVPNNRLRPLHGRRNTIDGP